MRTSLVHTLGLLHDAQILRMTDIVRAFNPQFLSHSVTTGSVALPAVGEN